MWFGKKKRAGSTGELPIELTPAYTNSRRQAIISHSNIACWSHIGMVRKNNEDSYYCSVEHFFRNNEPKYIVMAAVADGMGGLELGEEASSEALAQLRKSSHDRLIPLIIDQESVDHNRILMVLKEIVIEINRNLFVHFQQKHERSGSTLSAVVVFAEQCYIVHIGDSRIYMVDRNHKTLQQLTTDHSYVSRLVAMGQISAEEAKSHPRKNEIYKMLAFEPNVEPDVAYFTLESNQTLLLCSDGLTDMVDDRDILEYTLADQSLQEIVNGLGHLANQHGGYDNCTIVCLEPIYSDS